jgi:deoxyinosine 3'endonuclease (endonuclease V)
VYEDLMMVRLDLPYISGFLAFREAPHLLAMLDRLRERRPDLLPEVSLFDLSSKLAHEKVILMDGNGTLHPRGCGIACHFGVVADIPTVRVH